MTSTLVTIMAACAPLVHPTTLRALIQVESGGNPYAVSINHPQALRDRRIEVPVVLQPHSRRGALAETQTLLTFGFGASVGLAQINVEHLPEEHLGIADLFDPCTNLAVAQRVLLDCAARQPQQLVPSARQRLARTLSCYNTGDYNAGVRNHYVSDVTRAAMRAFYRSPRSSRSRM